MAFNLGWDADCNAATAATIVGVLKGRRWMNKQGWDIKDVYRNTTRDDMPADETLTSFENSLIEAARITIQRNGGEIPLPFREGQGEGSTRPLPPETVTQSAPESRHKAAATHAPFAGGQAESLPRHPAL